MRKASLLRNLVVTLIFSVLVIISTTCLAESRAEQINILFLNAISNGDLVTAQTMLDSGADINYTNNGKTHAFAWALSLRNDMLKQTPKIVHFLIEHGADVNAHFTSDGNYLSVLLHSIQATFCDYSSTVMMINNGADINEVDSAGNSVLHYLVKHWGSSGAGRNLIIDLVSKGADVNHANNEGVTPFMYLMTGLPSIGAGQNCVFLPVVKSMISHGATINYNYQGKNAVDWALAKGNIPVYQYLLAVEQGKVNKPIKFTTIPKSEMSIGKIACGHTLNYVEKMYGKPKDVLEKNDMKSCLYTNKFVVQGKKSGNDYRVYSVMCYQDGQETPSGFKVGSSFKNVVAKYGTVKGLPVDPTSYFYKKYNLEGCQEYTYICDDSSITFTVDKNQIIKGMLLLFK